MDEKSVRVEDQVFFGPITEQEKKARLLFQQRFGMKESDLSILYNMHDYELNDSESRQSISLLGEIETPEEAASLISLTDSIQEDLCNDVTNLNISRPKYETNPEHAYIKIEDNYSLKSEPEPRIFSNFEPQTDGLSILTEAAHIHSLINSKSSEDKVYSINSLNSSKLPHDSDVVNVKVIDTAIAKWNSNFVPKFNDTLEDIEELLSRRNQNETLTYPDRTTHLSDSRDRQTSIVKRTPSKHEQNVSNSKNIENLNYKSTELFEFNKEKKLTLEINDNSKLDAIDEFLSEKNEEKSHLYSDSTTRVLNSEPIKKHVKTPNKNRHFNIKNTPNIPEIKKGKDYSPKFKCNDTLDEINEFLSKNNNLEKLTTTSSSTSKSISTLSLNKKSSSPTRSTPSLTCNTESNSSRIPKNILSAEKEKPKSKQQTTKTISTPKLKKGKMLTPFKTPTQLYAQKQTNKPRKFDHIISPVAAYINKPSPRLIQKVKCEKSIDESKLRTPISEKENLDTNDISIQFPKVDYKKGPSIFLEKKIKSRLPKHLSSRMQNILPESSPILSKHIGHIQIDDNDKELSMVIRKN